MSTSYPAGLDALTNPVSTDPLSNPSHADQHTNANDAIEAIEAELGTDPAGAYATVKARLDVADTKLRFVPMAEQGVVNGSTTAIINSTLSAAIPGVPSNAAAVVVYARIQVTGALAPGNAVIVNHADLDTRAGIVYSAPTLSYFNTDQITVACDSSQRIRYAVQRDAGTVVYYIACIGYWTTG